MKNFIIVILLSALCNLAYSDIPVNDCSFLNNEDTDEDFNKISQCINLNINSINKIYDYLKSKKINISPIHINIKISKSGNSNSVVIEENNKNFNLIADYFKMINFPVLYRNNIYTAYFDESGKFLIEKSLLNGDRPKPVESFYIKGDLTAKYIRKTFDQHGKELAEKYLILLQENPQLEGTILYKIEILPTGVVKTVSVDKKDITISEKLAKELEIIISKFIFPKSDNGVTANYPINLYPN